MSDPPPAKKLSYSGLYGDLIAPRDGSVISAGPVKYDMKPKDPEPEEPKKRYANYQFTPAVRRPAQNKGKSKPPSSSLGARSSSTAAGAGTGVAGTSSSDRQLPSSAPQQPFVGPGLSYEDIMTKVKQNEDEEYVYNHKPKWQGRGGKKNKNKKNKKEEYEEVDWNAIYDPARPSNLARYQGSTEQDAERAEWTNFLHHHRNLAQRQSKTEKPKARGNSFAPPGKLSFAPPASNDAPQTTDPMDIDDDEHYPPPAAVARPTFNSCPSLPSSGPSGIPQDPTGEEPNMRRQRLSGMPSQPHQQSYPKSVPQAAVPVGSAPPGPNAATPPMDVAAKIAAAKAKIAAISAAKAKLAAAASSASSQNATALRSPSPAALPADASTISRAPVRYDLKDAQVDALLDREDAHAQPEVTSTSQTPASEARSTKPGQKGFGARMMAKMGYVEGQGLGAKGEGITTAIIAQPTKRKRRSDKDGGGWAQQPNMGRIVGGKKNKVEDDSDDLGIISFVVKLQGMLLDVDVAYEIEENNLQQEIGDRFSKSYGAIERLFIWREENGGNNEVFIKFTSQLSALNACKDTDGMAFLGNKVAARFFSAEKFEDGEYA